MTSSPEDTIAAVATPAGEAALSLLRISGPDALRTLKRAAGLKQVPVRSPILCRLIDASGAVIDQGLATYFPGPRSFTGEDVVEFSGHGGRLVTELALRRFLECGARPADPGEFSLRAFLNGKLDLTQAEAVMDIISARSETALKMANDQLSGALGTEITALRERIFDVLVELEAYIDFPDEGIDTASRESMRERTNAALEAAVALLDSADRGRKLREGIRTVIAGAPNAGKSSLLNWLTGRERAIVSGTPGTTRDTIEELVVCEGLPLVLVDTAGLRDSDDDIEREGIRRAEEEMRRADVILEVVDGSADPALAKRAAIIPGTPTLLVLNKSDLPAHPGWQAETGIAISCAEKTGLAELFQRISELSGTSAAGGATSRVAVNARHRNLLGQASESLRRALDGFAADLEAELIALELHEAVIHVGDIVGRVDADEILGGIFSRFCIGK